MSTTIYRLTIAEDTDFDIEDLFEFEEDKKAAYRDGVVGFILESITACGECHQDVVTHLDSCWGFIACHDYLAAILEQVNFPEGVTINDCKIVYK